VDQEISMKQAVAEQINSLMLDINAHLDSSIRLVMDNSEQKEFEKYRQIIGKIMGEIFVEILTPMYVEYPDLKPEGLRKS
jgi:wyosine [tRNA(Phe)-imidazoG37] synthetase (radical SAM superfamily)